MFCYHRIEFLPIFIRTNEILYLVRVLHASYDMVWRDMFNGVGC